MRLWRSTGCLAAAALTFAAAILPQNLAHAASAADAVAYRRHVMKTMGEQAAALGMVLQGLGPAENAARHARTIALMASAALKAFEVRAPGGEARDDIWRTWDDFAQRLQALSSGAEQLAAIAEREGVAAARARAMNVLSCKSCHDIYTLRQGR